MAKSVLANVAQTVLHIALFLILAVSIVHAQWTQVLKPPSAKIFSIVEKGSDVFVAFEFNVFRTSDNGATWTYSNTGLSSSATVFSLAVKDSLLLAGSVGEGVYRSEDNGFSFVQTGLATGSISSIVVLGKYIIANTCCGRPYRSTDNGYTWLPIADSNFTFSTMVSSGSTLFAGTKKGIYKSNDSGTTWINVYPEPARIMGATANTIFAGKSNSGILRSTDNGNTWKLTAGNPPNLGAFVIAGNNVFLGNGEGVYQSSDNGNSWHLINTGLVPYKFTTTAGPDSSFNVFKLMANNGYLFAGISGGGIWRRPLSEIASANHQHPMDKFIDGFTLNENLGSTIRSGDKMEFTVAHHSSVTLELFNSNGEKKATLVKTEVTPGTHDLQFSGEGITEGIYFLRLNVSGTIRNRRITFLK